MREVEARQAGDLRCWLLAAGALCAAQADAGSGSDAIHTDGFEDAACAPLYPMGFLLEWSQTYPQGWPGYNQVARFYPQVDTYMTLRFTAGPAGQLGELLGNPVASNGRMQGLLSISRSPGCFDAAHTGARCVSALAPVLSLSWTTGSSPFRCQLEPGGTYYVNLTLGGLEPPGPYCDRKTELCMIELGQNYN